MFHKKWVKLRGDSIHPNKQTSLYNSWLELKHKVLEDAKTDAVFFKLKMHKGQLHKKSKVGNCSLCNY